MFSNDPTILGQGCGTPARPNKHEPQAPPFRTPEPVFLRLVVFMIKNTERQKQKRKQEEERRREKARWIAGLIDVVALAADGTRRTVEGDEAVEAILREWDRAYEELTREEEADEAR